MLTTREIIAFFAGAEAFHTLTHIFMSFSGMLPLKFYSINWTQQLNMYGIIINLVITVALFWWFSVA